MVLGFVKNINLNIIGDTIIPMLYNEYKIEKVILTRASVNLTGTSANIIGFTGRDGTGTQVIDGTGSLSPLDTPSKFTECFPASETNNNIFTQESLYARVSVVHGSSAFVSLYILGAGFI